MLDVFFCTTIDHESSYRELRRDMMKLCYDRWLEEKDVNFHYLTPSLVECSVREFQRSRRIYADRHADSSIYVVADDDCFITPRLIPRMLELMNSRPQHGILAPLPVGFIYPDGLSDVLHRESVGGVRFCRKLPESFIWPETGGLGYDYAHCQALSHQLSLKFGYAIEVPLFHLGEGYSTVWKEQL